MRVLLRTFPLAPVVLFAATLLAQQPITIAFSGNVFNCTGGDTVHVWADQGHLFPAIDLRMALDSNCNYLGYAKVQSPWIKVTTSTPCASIPIAPDYSMDLSDNNGDTLFAPSLNLSCLGHVDCLNRFGLWTTDYECRGEVLHGPSRRSLKKY